MRSCASSETDQQGTNGSGCCGLARNWSNVQSGRSLTRHATAQPLWSTWLQHSIRAEPMRAPAATDEAVNRNRRGE
jgi:hypothetical protein